jgi:hypothetical protein
MLSFLENVIDCRNSLILKHLGERPKECDEDSLVFCDNCCVNVLLLLMRCGGILQFFDFNCNIENCNKGLCFRRG